MDWNTIPIEIIERILVFTCSPRTVLNATFVSKNWQAIGEDQLLWKELFYATSSIKYKGDDEVDWKKKVMDAVLIRNNIKQGRCIIKTLSTLEALTNEITLHPDNSSVHKDFHLVNWQTTEHFGSYGDVTRLKSHFIDMVREEYIEVDDAEVAFIGNYIAKAPSSYYGGMTYKNVRVQSFDEEKSRQGQVFDPSKAIKLPIPESVDNAPIMNYCDHSKYIGFSDSPYEGPCTAFIIDGTTGTLVYRKDRPGKDASDQFLGLYDNYFAIRPWQSPTPHEHLFILVDIVTQTKIKKHFKEKYELCLMREDELANKFVIWNYKTDTETEYPVGQLARDVLEYKPTLAQEIRPVKMIYNDMWLVVEKSSEGYSYGLVLSFYDMKDGAKVGSVSLKNSSSTCYGFSQLSDGRLAVCLTSGCHVISFMNSEVTRMIKVLLMGIDGAVNEHQIMAHQLVDSFVKLTEGSLENMTSRVVPYQSHSENERYVMLFSFSTDKPHNATATALFKEAVKPTQVNTPYQPWRCDNTVIHYKSKALTQVHGPVMIVKEQKIGGRWQLA